MKGKKDFERQARRSPRPDGANQGPNAHRDARIAGLVCLNRALRTRSTGGAYPRRLSRGAYRAIVPLRFALEGRAPDKSPSNPQAAKPLPREAFAEAGQARWFGFSALASPDGQPSRPRRPKNRSRQTSRINPQSQRRAVSIRTQNRNYIGGAKGLGKVFPELLPDGHSAGDRRRLWSQSINREGPMPWGCDTRAMRPRQAFEVCLAS